MVDAVCTLATLGQQVVPKTSPMDGWTIIRDVSMLYVPFHLCKSFSKVLQCIWRAKDHIPSAKTHCSQKETGGEREREAPMDGRRETPTTF